MISSLVKRYEACAKEKETKEELSKIAAKAQKERDDLMMGSYTKVY